MTIRLYLRARRRAALMMALMALAGYAVPASSQDSAKAKTAESVKRKAAKPKSRASAPRTATPKRVVEEPKWPVDAPDPLPGSILPAKRIVAFYAKQILDAGGLVQLGAHGQLQGLGAHWELWMLQQGGMSPLEAIKCATINGAKYLGLDGEIGSLEKGKLADLVVLDRNPLDNIRNSEALNMVMLNGRLYDAKTLNEIGNHPRPHPVLWFEKQ